MGLWLVFCVCVCVCVLTCLACSDSTLESSRCHSPHLHYTHRLLFHSGLIGSGFIDGCAVLRFDGVFSPCVLPLFLCCLSVMQSVCLCVWVLQFCIRELVCFFIVWDIVSSLFLCSIHIFIERERNRGRKREIERERKTEREKDRERERERERKCQQVGEDRERQKDRVCATCVWISVQVCVVSLSHVEERGYEFGAADA